MVKKAAISFLNYKYEHENTRARTRAVTHKGGGREREPAYGLPHPSTDNSEELFPPANPVLVLSPACQIPHMNPRITNLQI